MPKIERKKTVYDINPNPDKIWFKIKAMVKCFKCGKMTDGDIILDRKNLSVADTAGFMILEEIECDKCCESFRRVFGEAVEDAASDLGLTPEELAERLGIIAAEDANKKNEEK